MRKDGADIDNGYGGRYRRRGWVPAVPALAGLALLTACGGAGHGGTGSAAPAAASAGASHGMVMPRQSGAASPAAPAAANTVAIKNFAFAPAAVTVRAGTTVTWTNDDEEPHTVTATGGPFRSAALGTGATFRYTFAKPGRYAYVCTIHPFMRGTVVVTR